MDSKIGLDGNHSFAYIVNDLSGQRKEKLTIRGHTDASVMPLVSSDTQVAGSCQQTSIRLRRYSNLDHCRADLFKHIEETFLGSVGINVNINKNKLVFDLTENVCEDQDCCFEASEYHYLIGEVFSNTDIPDLLRAERLIPIVQKSDGKNQLIVEFKDAPQAYIHTLGGEEMPLKTIPITPFYNPKALNDVDTSMLWIDMYEVGFTDGSPRYIFTTGLSPCICVALFDKSQNKVLLCHLCASDFSPENLSEIFQFCGEQKMQNLECHIVGGYYNYLGTQNGFLSLIDFISSKGVPINQMFVGDTKDRPKSVVIDTRDMRLYGLPFCQIDHPAGKAERFVSKKKVAKIANIPLLTKIHSLSLFTLGSDS
ncbi:hypothetical protein [Endozoicomonas sp. ISHI1]|uniref:hypothetical protein n=1 Tax=Endozoicomonas sp. ISHI1 TaxID=2825882 RepID=UPI002148EC75|nr:hypothetical protein [Endozoicomonas sp. ISHI1]